MILSETLKSMKAKEEEGGEVIQEIYSFFEIYILRYLLRYIRRILYACMKGFELTRKYRESTKETKLTPLVKEQGFNHF